MQFENKLVGIINKDIDTGVAMNALAHMTLGFGTQFSSEQLRMDTYVDKDGNAYPNISQMPFIILRGKSGEIKKALAAAQEQGMHVSAFTNTMTGGTYQEQIDNTAKTSYDDLAFYGAVIYGPWEAVSQITKRLSLYR